MSLLNQAIYTDSQSWVVCSRSSHLSPSLTHTLTNDKHHGDNDQQDWMLYRTNHHHDMP